MLSLFLWTICLYGFILFGFKWIYSHVCFKVAKEIEKENLHYLILAKDNQSIIEWVIRSLWFSQCLSSYPIKITILDLESVDDTREIIQRLNYKHLLVEVIEVKDLTKVDEIVGRMVEEVRKRGEKVKIVDLLNYEKGNEDDLSAPMRISK
ncbi:hypothetical protein [Tepidibacillus marianensis]|uniref:hypothetical protein n=1 Tax=Tepidibacillus marianensis TaxID=3131995 RepID=UPI0030CBF04F